MGELPGVKGATILDQGTFSELLKRGRDLSNILQEQKKPPTTTAAPDVAVGQTSDQVQFSCHRVPHLLEKKYRTLQLESRLGRLVRDLQAPAWCLD